MSAKIYIYCPRGSDGLARFDLEEQLEVFFNGAAEDCGAGTGENGYNLDYELRDGEVPQLWAHKLKSFLEQAGVRRGTVFDVFPNEWRDGMEWQRCVPFGTDEWQNSRQP